MDAMDHLAREATQLQTVISKMTVNNFSLKPLLPLFIEFLTDENFDRLRDLGELGKLSYLQVLFEAFLRGSHESRL
jgi:hypothetical protein